MPTGKTSILGRFLIWRVRHIPHRQFIMIASAVVGILSGVAAVTIKTSAHFIEKVVTQGIIRDYYLGAYFVFPALGLLLSFLFIKYIVRNPVSHGIPTVLHTISKKNGIMKRYQMFASLVASSITVGFGGSVGLEGPTVSTGAALGSNFGQLMHLNYRHRILLIGCAAAGTMAAIFKAPIAAVVFAIEVFMLDLTFSSLVPLLISSVLAVLTSYLFTGDDYIIPTRVTESFQFGHIPYYILLAVVSTVVSIYIEKVFFATQSRFGSIKNDWTKLAIGGLLLGVLVFVFPSLYGEGFDVINGLLAGQEALLFRDSLFYWFVEESDAIAIMLFLVMALKIVATSVTWNAGGVGGIFSPTLFMGSTMGYLFARIARSFGAEISMVHFTLVGMAGLMAGVLHAPMTAIFLIAELTGGYQLFVPLMIVATLSFTLTKAFSPHSIYTQQLAQRGELLTHNKDKLVLSRLRMAKVLETDFKSIKPNDTLGQLVKVVAQSRRNIFPVLNDDGELLGVLLLDDIRHVMFDREMYDQVKVSELMHQAPAFIDYDEPMQKVMDKFKSTGAWNLPVLNNGLYVGFISKSKLFSAYRRLLVQFSDE
ncbi:MAG: chloride channel protein [Flavobacteriales bacterium]|nr:chloride channel protein [Flavobacteriales bacterium]